MTCNTCAHLLTSLLIERGRASLIHEAQRRNAPHLGSLPMPALCGAIATDRRPPTRGSRRMASVSGASSC
jgi:hypothetical protein